MIKLKLRERASIAGKILFNSVQVIVHPDDNVNIVISDYPYSKGGNMVDVDIGNATIEIPRDEYRKFISNMLFALWTGIFGEINSGKRLKIEYDTSQKRWNAYMVYL